MEKITFQKGKKKREELFLPALRFVVATDWIDKIGPKAFAAWLKFHTWVDRRDTNREHDKIPYTLEDVAEKLGMSKSTLYRTIIRPLWEHYLIDLIEYEESNRKTQKPMNIIVYESPMNSHETEVKPLEKLRDWDKDYASASQLFGRKGGRPKKEEIDIQEELVELFGNGAYRFKNKTVVRFDLNRFKNKTVYRFKNKTVTVSKIKPNNYSNKLFILSNKPNNKSNNHHQGRGDEAPTIPISSWESDHHYKLIRDLFTLNGFDDIRKPEAHYEKFKQAIQKVKYEKLIQAATTYINEVKAGQHEHSEKGAQVVWFLGGGFNDFIKTVQSASQPSKKEEKMPQSLKWQLDAGEQEPPKYNEEELADKQASIQAKLRLMNERLRASKKEGQPV